MGGGYMRVLFIFLILVTVFLSACSTSAPIVTVTKTQTATATPPTVTVTITTPTPTSIPTTTPEYYPFESYAAYYAAEEHAQLLVYQRLQNLAQNYIAREYVEEILSTRSWGKSEYNTEEKAWLIVIHGSLQHSYTWLTTEYAATLHEYW
jgi:PBP1b-binding outer membrane lipoprotein LpoB